MAIMKNIISILCIFFILPLTAQNTFEIKIEIAEDNFTTSAVETNHYYFINRINRPAYTDTITTTLLKITKEGEIVLSSFLKDDYFRYYINELLILNTGHIVGFGYQREKLNGTAYFIIVEWDDNLNILNETLYETPYALIEYINVKLIGEKFIVVGSGFSNVNMKRKVFSYLMDSNFDTLVSNTYPGKSVLSLNFDISPGNMSETYKLFGTLIDPELPYISQIITIDESLEIVDYNAMPGYMIFYNDAKPYNSQSYLLSGLYQIPEKAQEDQLALAVMDENTDTLISMHLLGATDTSDYPGFYGNLDYLDTDNIYYGGTMNMGLGTYLPIDSWFFLNKLDSNLEVQWQKFYGGDAYYSLWDLIATQDGGCLMAGSVYDDQMHDNFRDIYIIKVNEDGLIVGTGEESGGLMAQDAIVYPNPGNEFLKVQSGPQINGALFELFDLYGNLILSSTLNERMETINTNAHTPGTYPYRVTYQNKIVASGKWVKQY